MRWSCLLLLFLLCGCDGVSVWPRPTPHTIPFETIEQSGAYYDGPIDINPSLILLTSPEQIVNIEAKITSQTRDALLLIDFQRYVVIGLFRGLTPTGGYNTTITQITQHENQVVVHAELQNPDGGADEISAPYHLVQIERTQLPTEQPELVLESTFVTPTPIVR
jgi:hypothetical protein